VEAGTNKDIKGEDICPTPIYANHQTALAQADAEATALSSFATLCTIQLKKRVEDNDELYNHKA
jgi:hypothetical protein